MPFDPYEKSKSLKAEERQTALQTLPQAPDSMSAEDLQALNTYILTEQGVKEEVATNGTKNAEGTLVSLGVELGSGFTLSHFTKSGARASKTAQNVKSLLDTARGVKAASAVGVATPELVSTVTGAVGFVAAEGLIWGFSNFLGQEVRKAYGIQDATRASELMAAVAFGIVATPIDSSIVSSGRKYLSKRIPLKLTDDKIGTAFKTRELMIKGSPAVVSGAVLGMAETAMRQEVSILLDEEGATRDAMEYMYAAGIGGGLNSVFHVFSRTGAFGRKQATKVTDRAVDRSKERIKLLEKELKRHKKFTTRSGGVANVAKGRVREVERKIKDELQVIALIESFGDEIKKASKIAEKQEVTPAADVVVKPDPLDKPKAPVEEPTTPGKETPVEEPKAPVKSSDQESKMLPAEKVDSIIADFSEDLDNLSNLEEQIRNGTLNADNVKKTVIPAVINKARKITDAAEFDAENAIRKLIKNEDRGEAFKDLQQALAIQIRVKEEVLGPLNNVVGNGVRANRKDVVIETELGDLSVASMEELSSLRNLKTYVDTFVAGDLDDDFADLATEYLASKNKIRRKQRQQAREKAKDEQVVNLETRVKELEEKLAEKKAVAAGKPANQPKTAKEKAEAQLEKERKDFVEGEDTVAAPKKPTKETDPELQELTERIAFYKKNKKEAAEIEELEASIDKLTKLGEEGDPEKISKIVGKKPKWAGPQKTKSYLEDLRKVDKALRRELGESLKPQKTPEERLQDKLEAQQQRLQQQLDELRERAVGPKAKKANELAEEKPTKKEDTAEIKNLKTRIKAYQKFEKEAANYKAAIEEEQRLKEILQRGDSAEMRKEVGRMPGSLKNKAESKYEKALKEVANRKKAMRTVLTKLAKQEERIIKAKRDKELWERYSNYLESAHKSDGIGRISKFFRGVRIARKMALIDSLPSAAAALPTGAFELGRNLIKPISTRFFDRKEPLANKIALMEFAEGLRGLVGLLKGPALKHAARAFKEARDPNYGSSDKFDINSSIVSKSILPTGVRQAISKAKADAALREQAEQNIKNWISSKTITGNFFAVLSLGMRSIMAADAVFKRQLREVAARKKFKRQALLEFPDDKVAADARFEELYSAASKDLDGVHILEGVDELADEFALIDEALLMTATKGDMVDAKNSLINQMLKPVTQQLNRDDQQAVGAIIEALMPFLGVGVKSVQRMTRFSGGVVAKRLIPGLPNNPFNTAVKYHEREIEKLKGLLKEATTSGDLKTAQNVAKLTKQQQELLKVAETRRVLYNKEELTDALMFGSLAAIGFISGYAGNSNGTNAWMTDSQKARNKEKKPFTFMGTDIRAAVPFNGPLVVFSDLGNYIRAKNEGKLSREMNLPLVLANAGKGIIEELPMHSGVQQAQQITGKDAEGFWNAFSRLSGSYIPVPAQIRKQVEDAARNGTLNDLRGLKKTKGFVARVYYNVTGAGAPNTKRDIFGEERESGKTWLHSYWRFASSSYKAPTKIDEILAGDKESIVVSKIPEKYKGISLLDYRDEDGYTLYSYLADKIKKKNVKREINKLVREPEIKKLLKTEELRGETGDYLNLGLIEINKEIQAYYREAQAELEEDTRNLKRFINIDGETAASVLGKQKEIRKVPIPTP